MNVKNIFRFSAILMIVASGITSCSKVTDDVTPKTDSGEIIVPLSIGGEISNLGNTPLGRASGTDLLYLHACTVDQNGHFTEYAYGLFDDFSNIDIALREGVRYSFFATLIKEGKTRILNDNGYWCMPFNSELTNEFIYDDNYDYSFIRQGYAQLADGMVYMRPELDRYYGETQPSVFNSGNTVKIDLARTVFGIKVITENFTDGSLLLYLYDEKAFEITAPQTEASKVFSLYDLSQAFNIDVLNKTEYTNQYKEFVTVKVVRKNAGNEEIPVGEQSIQFTRNMMTTLKVKIKSDMFENGVSITTESTAMIDSGEVIEFEGGGDF